MAVGLPVLQLEQVDKLDSGATRLESTGILAIELSGAIWGDIAPKNGLHDTLKPLLGHSETKITVHHRVARRKVLPPEQLRILTSGKSGTKTTARLSRRGAD